MQIGIRFHDTVELPFEQRLKEIKKQGFSCTHIALSKVPGFTANPTALTPGYAMYLRDAFRHADLDVAVLGCYLNLATPDEAALRANQEKYMAHIRFASLMGAGMVGTETGAPNVNYSYDKEACHSQEALETFITNLKPVVEYAEKMGVIVAIEPVYRHIVYSPKRAREVLDRIESPNLQIIFDPVNLLWTDNYAQRYEVFEEAMDILEKEICMIHLKDCVLENDGVKSMACGLGELDYSSIIKFTNEKKPFIHATLEDTKPDNAVAAREYIQNLEQAKMI
ncbi:sugar phosphate isomerase/epimerase family protein [Butyrivibrio sp. YAB3001]|uniref:sugar phosphate isomerase/epimerase family protein n=1 Tax=Butyrivibrio sp. YAB3001 TaxID=1520812 RepID=UPI0008F66C7C|nr:sugar phosphate isomerase/epimerase family protein [Butyrivibrio sp. YAB3001]SFC37358.1 Sugar phosphate isomerase/epimerase [Butyrivibrio sp. YAB3001]